jgi:hypothetical protein
VKGRDGARSRRLPAATAAFGSPPPTSRSAAARLAAGPPGRASAARRRSASSTVRPIERPKNSVGTAQLQQKAVTGAKLKKNAITGVKVKNRTLTAADFQAGQLPAGPQGPKGDPGPQGSKGDKGDTGDPGATKVTKRDGAPGVVAAPGFSSSSTASCEAGETLVGGGVGFANNTGKPEVAKSAPTYDGKWMVTVRNDWPSGSLQAVAFALCAAP